MKSKADHFEYIVVGAGASGCVLANRLSADPTARILLLEAGGRDQGIWMRLGMDNSASPSPAQFRAMLKEEVNRWTSVVKAAGILPE